MHSIGNQIGSKVRNLAQMGRPAVEIELRDPHGAHGSYVTSYSTMDRLEGTVSITADRDTRFEDIEIAFIGVSKTYVDRLTSTPSLSGRTEATHRFLKLTQPIDQSSLPQPRIAVAGKTYKFPFTFVIPRHLLPRACVHKTASDHVRETHLQLPPSLGDPELAGHGGTLLDDLAPEMSRITYGVKVRITQLRDTDGLTVILQDKMKKVRVKPAFEEQPPVNVDAKDETYRLRQEKTIRKGMFKGKMGSLVMECMQPKALCIPGARSSSSGPITTMAKVQLRFDPSDDSSLPPRLGSLVTKMKVATYFSSSPRHNFPNRNTMTYDLTQGYYSEMVPLSTLCVGSAQWEKHSSEASPALARRDSGISDCSSTTSSATPYASKTYSGKTFYTANIIVPITLPSTKNFVPTFHSCLISRVYLLSLNLSVHAPGVGDPSLQLRVPVQISAKGSESGEANFLASRIESLALEDADAMWQPRSVAPPRQEFARAEAPRGGDAPPEYAFFAPGPLR
ncbi:arrestin [Lepidopterella palustris CBS 459.81]|uniref:Arrestin n=1 Tax=Lepidopterella palustris CBS 459.81 TaxID=1314670 RepID=A0A8E2E6G5_9PEZI|nr:arrestin [Lepidopterella palustris CBS 459.81]